MKLSVALGALIGLLGLAAVAVGSASASPMSKAAGVGHGLSVDSTVQTVDHRGRRFRRRGGTTVIETAPSGGTDLTTLMLLGALGGGTGDMTSILPLLALQGSQSNTTVVETRRRRFR